mmetsp:Transcript_15247/g.50071  ORF Transcript_15247/g.50071 Transcript_15247/m.50071 type:complete len:282 (+) Transcript_15247:1253-2098(+)
MVEVDRSGVVILSSIVPGPRVTATLVPLPLSASSALARKAGKGAASSASRRGGGSSGRAPSALTVRASAAPAGAEGAEATPYPPAITITVTVPYSLWRPLAMPAQRMRGSRMFVRCPRDLTPSSIRSETSTSSPLLDPKSMFSAHADCHAPYLRRRSEHCEPSEPVWPVRPDGPRSATWSAAARSIPAGISVPNGSSGFVACKTLMHSFTASGPSCVTRSMPGAMPALMTLPLKRFSRSSRRGTSDVGFARVLFRASRTSSGVGTPGTIGVFTSPVYACVR